LAGEGEVRTRYLPFEKTFDEESSKWGVVGKDTHGEDFGVGVGETVEVAAQRLRSWVLDSLLASAADSVDALGDLHDAEPVSEDSISFTPVDLLPIRLRLLRARQHLSQAHVAERLGMSQQAYAKYERPGVNPELKTLMQLERALEGQLLEFA
jgi:DNA-binding XRE family transcriptional regulator